MQHPTSREYSRAPLNPAENPAAGTMLQTALSSGWMLAAFAITASWLLFFNQIRGEWQINPQYNYGYVVPLLGAVLLWRRWPGRPEPSPANAQLTSILGLGLLLLALPLRILFEANPEWRLLYWIGGFQILGLSFCLLDWLGGSKWVRYFAPPFLFMLVALPWPMDLEQSTIQGLMRLVAGLTVTVVNLLGFPAIQHGNLIEVKAGLVGIDEACSGVRSLQSSLMLSLFLGEMNRWSWKRRLALLAASMLFVLLANVVRTSFLVYTAANSGMHQMEAWHDTAGFLIMVIVLPGLLGLSYWMRPRQTPNEPAPISKFVPFSIPRWVGMAIVLWLAVTEVATEIWYRVHEKNLVANVNWSVAWPENAPHFRKTTLPENSRVILRCDHTESAVWQDDIGDDWSGFVLNWEPGKNSTQLARGHRPDICFPATGAKLAKDYGNVTITADGFDIPFHYQSFESGDRLLHVFYCLWSDKIVADALSRDDSSRNGRIHAALAGERNLGQKVLEIVICGPETRDEAIALLRSQARALIRKG